MVLLLYHIKSIIFIFIFYFLRPKNVDFNSNESEIRSLYKRTSLFIRSLFTIIRLLPVYPLIQQKLPFLVEISDNTENLINLSTILGESLLSEDEEKKSFESVNRTELSILQTNHGDMEISIQFKKISVKFYTIFRSPAIRVPQRVIKARDIHIKSSSGSASGDWIDMTQHHMYTIKKHPTPIKILTTAHKPTSSLAEQPNPLNVTDFVKEFEYEPETEMSPNHHPTINQMVQLMEAGRSKKINFDRWLEELEIEHESIIGFDLINNME